MLETIRSSRAPSSGDTPLIGFAGAPFTVATYAIEGKTAKNFSETKKLFYREPEAARRLLALIAEATRDYLLAQIRAGAQAVQLFDSWVGVLSAEDFETLRAAADRGAGRASCAPPASRSSTSATARRSILDRVARVGASVYGVDWRLPIDEARANLGNAAAVQGNLDPSTLLGPIADVERRARDIVRRGGKRGHVFNLGHGIYPETPDRGGRGAGRRGEGRMNAGGRGRTPTPAAAARAPIGLVVMNLGGPASLDDVEPFLRRLFGDPDVIQLGWLSFLQPLLARTIAQAARPAVARGLPADRRTLADPRGDDRAGRSGRRRARAPRPRGQAGRRDGGLAPVRRRGAGRAGRAGDRPRGGAAALPARVAGDDRLVAEPARRRAARARPGRAIEIAAIKRYPDADGYVRAVVERVEEAIATLPAEHRATAPVLFSAHGLPEAYIKRGDPYLDDVRLTVETVSRRLGLGARARLCFQSRVGPQRWLGPTTEAVLDELAAAGTPRGRRRPDRVHGRAHRDAAGDRHPLQRARPAGGHRALRARPHRRLPPGVHRRARGSGRGDGARARLGLRSAPVRVTIVGGGISGLTAAHARRRAGTTSR